MLSSSRGGRQKGEGGQVLVLVVIGLAAFLAFLGLVLEGGRAYVEQRKLQRAADTAALSATWAYYNKNYEGIANAGFNPDITAGMTAAVASANEVVGLQATPDTAVTVCFVDYRGEPLASSVVGSSCAGATAGRPDVRGVTVTLSRTLGLDFLRAVGVNGAALGATATAQLGPPTGAVHVGPLLLQGYTDASFAVPRNSPYSPGPCPANPGSGFIYPTSSDCRPRTDPSVSVQLVPTWGPARVLPSPLDRSTAIRFNLLHDSPTCASDGVGNAPSTCDPAQSEVATGEGGDDPAGSDIILACPPATPAACPAGPTYYAEVTRPAAFPVDGVLEGFQDRVNLARAGWPGQDCTYPLTGAPLTSDNPRLVRLPVNYDSPPVAGGGSNTAAVHVSETLVFCVQYTDRAAALPPRDGAGAYVIPGYIVNQAPLEATLLATSDPYFGADVAIRLLR